MTACPHFVIVIALVRLLFVSLDSATAPSASARARMYQVPAAVPGGIVTDVEPGLEAPLARIGTARLPSRRSAASKVVFVER